MVNFRMKSLTFCCVPMLVTCFYSNLVAAETILTKNLNQGALIVGKTLPENTVALINPHVKSPVQLKVSNDGDFVFGFGRDENRTYKIEITDKAGRIETRTLIPKKREYNIQRINGIKQSIMKPNPVAVKRSSEDNAQIREARKTVNPFTFFAEGFIAPIDGTITGVYGSQRVFNGEKKRPHYGLDYAGKIGDPVKAPANGKILLFVPDMFYSGGTMIIDHGHGVTSTFLHLSGSLVKKGDMVKQGQVIAKVGASGRATGPHLDWRINWFDIRLDPAYVLQLKTL